MSKSDWTVGVDIGGTKVNVARVDKEGKLWGTEKIVTRTVKEPAAMVAAIAEAVKKIIAAAGTAPLGIGIGVAGQIERETGLIHFAPNLDWHNVPLREMLSKATSLPVVVTNDVRAAAWGEWIHGSGRGSNDILCLFLGTGIGGGVVSGGKMLTGCSNSAGELGHITVDLKGPPCTCGNVGCMEAIASGWALAKQAQKAVAADPEQGEALLQMAGGDIEEITGRMVVETGKAGDPLSRKILERAAEAAAGGCVGLVNAFNPQKFILGGGLMSSRPELLDIVKKAIAERALPIARASVEVLPATLGNEAGVIGAATLAMKIFSGD